MKLENYRKRLIDKQIDENLKTFGALLIEGPKQCGKTSSSIKAASMNFNLSDIKIRENVLNNPDYIFSNNSYPILIDEWQLIPELWDYVRNKCDEDLIKGKFILTGSRSLKSYESDRIVHSGIGRIHTMQMYPMTLYETNDSTGSVSIQGIINGKFKSQVVKSLSLHELARLIVRGGWPAILDDKNDTGKFARSYISNLINIDIPGFENNLSNKNPRLLNMLVWSLARNESTNASKATILKDICDNGDKELSNTSRITIDTYLNSLEKNFIVINDKPYSINYRSSARIGSSPKRHLVDPSLSCAALKLTVEKLVDDLNTFGLMLEALVMRDLRVYANYLDADLFYFRDNNSGDEVDAIIEFYDGEYCALEIKLTGYGVQEAKKSLLKFYKYAKKKPKFMCIILGCHDITYQDKETGIYIIPINCLKP